MADRLVVMARWPAPGRCKRRLATHLGIRSAAAIQARLTQHTLAAATDLSGAGGPELVLAVSGLGPRAARRWGRQLRADRVILQGDGDLGLRMARQLSAAQRAGSRRLVLIGSDLPELSVADLTAAFEALERVPLVLGPAADGGYWLIGLRLDDHRALSRRWRPIAARRLFSGDRQAMPWSTTALLPASLAVARRLGLASELLAQRSDLDRREDLRRWATPCWS